MQEAKRPEGMGNCLTAFLRDPGWREVKGREDSGQLEELFTAPGSAQPHTSAAHFLY